MLDGLSFADGPEIPLPGVRLEIAGGIPNETGVAELSLQGKTEPEAALLLAYDAKDGERQTLSVGSANRKGDFTLDALLPEQGDYLLTLTAEKNGFLTSSLSGGISYRAGLLAVHIENIPDALYDRATYKLAGTAPAGANLQILAGNHPAVQRKVGADGRFGVELDTGRPGEYRIVVIAALKGYEDRRIEIEFTRVTSQTEDRCSQSARQGCHICAAPSQPGVLRRRGDDFHR
jgi:hypothetical protein